jgi:beta-phosphoglucomutase-like phosphatase (HAD superfamily)
VTATTQRRRQPPVVLCDADGILFDSEAPAYEASAGVTNALLAEVGIDARFTAEELRLGHTGMNFRTTAVVLCRQYGVDLGDEVLSEWVERERIEVTRRLADTLVEDPAVTGPVAALRGHLSLALVSSSASSRLDACLKATRLDRYFPVHVRFSAEDSLPLPCSKPDPAIYRLAGERMRCTGVQGLAIEDSAVGVRAAVGAGFPVVGIVHFVAPDEREDRRARLAAAGAEVVVERWSDIPALLGLGALAPGG